MRIQLKTKIFETLVQVHLPKRQLGSKVSYLVCLHKSIGYSRFFLSLIIMPEALLNKDNPSHSLSISRLEPSQNIRMSSTKSKWEMHNTWEILIPLKLPEDFASSENLLKPSATNKKRKCDSGHPCLKTFSEWKKDVFVPLIRIARDTEERHPITHLIKSTPNPRWIRSILMYNQFTLL